MCRVGAILRPFECASVDRGWAGKPDAIRRARWPIEPSHCRHGMWVHGCGLFRISTEPEFSEFITSDRGSAVRIRTGGCGGEDPIGAELPHPLRAHHPGRPGAFGYLCARGVSVRDRIGALGGGVRFLLAETNTEPGSCGASHDPCCAREEEDQEAARGGVGRTAVNVCSISGSPVSGRWGAISSSYRRTSRKFCTSSQRLRRDQPQPRRTNRRR